MESFVSLALRMQKSLKTPTSHIIIPRLLLSLLIAELRNRITDPREVNRELHKLGVWVGSRCMAVLAKRKDLEKVHPRDQNPEGTARGLSVYAKAAWYLFAGHFPTIETKIIELEKGFLIRGVLKPDPGKDHIFKGIVSPTGISSLYLAAGAYEAATSFAFKTLEIDNLWFSLWRPREEGLVGFYIWHEAPLNLAVEEIKREYPDFFDVVSLEDSDRFLKEYLGVRILR